VAEHLYPLTLNGTAQTNRHTPVSELMVVNPTTFLMLERDSLGLGVGTNTPPSYKRVVIASTLGATNVAGGPYDLAPGTPGQASLPVGQPPSGVTPLARKDLIDLIDPIDLARFGLNVSINQDANTLSEKWEALGLVSLKDPARPDDYLLLVGNDNDFKSSVVFHNGVAVGTNDVPVDNMILAYHVTLPGVGGPAPALSAPTVAWASPAPDVYAAAPMVLGTTVYDDDGRVVKAEFLEDGVLVGMGAILLNDVRVGRGSIIAAGAVVTEGTVVPPGSLVVGVPGKVVRALSVEQQAGTLENAARYVALKEMYRNGSLRRNTS
jgi:acetyltransferase-like isoleucine patch superfamily enzyme